MACYPKAFGKIHPKYQTPWFSTIVTGCIVAIPSLFMEIGLMTDLTSIGTLFAFVLVSGGVLMLPQVSNLKGDAAPGKFRLPYINGRFIIPLLYILYVYRQRDRITDDIMNITQKGLQEILFLLFLDLVHRAHGAYVPG